ncbi:MAG: hypothetical protein ACRDBQ_25180 [Shewanella sp.]
MGSNPMAMLLIPALYVVVLVVIRFLNLLIMDLTSKGVPMNKYVSFTLRFFGCFLETVWAGLTSIVFGQTTGYVTHVVALAKCIYHNLHFPHRLRRSKRVLGR